nr:hypothetical protein GCM10020093_103120 [Planobispora longispora]
MLGRLGAGGQGVVYLAELAEPARSAESAGGERVAVKVLHRHAAGDLGPFLAEAEMIRRVRAFCTAQVVDSGWPTACRTSSPSTSTGRAWPG